MSRGLITTVAGGSRRPFLLSSSLLMTMIIVVMMPTSAANTIEMTNLSPANGFDIGTPNRLDITCQYDFVSFVTFELLQNTTTVVQMSYIINERVYKISIKENGFDCSVPTSTTTGEVKCWKTNLKCQDATSYTCKSTSSVKSESKSLTVRSSIGSLENTNPPYELYRVATFTCTANAASSERTVDFQWIVNNKKRNSPVTESKSVTVPSNNQCYRRIQSEFEYNVTREDDSNTTISCRVFDETRDVQIYIDMPSIFPTVGHSVDNAGGLDGGTIAGIVLGVIAFIILIVLLVWFFVIRKNKNKEKGGTKDTAGPPPNQKDYEVRENNVYAAPNKAKQREPSSEMPADSHVYDTEKSSRRHPKKGSRFLPSRGDATDQLDGLDEPYSPPPPPPKTDNSYQPSEPDQLHYAELELAVKHSSNRRSKYIPRHQTPYAEVELATLTRN